MFEGVIDAKTRAVIEHLVRTAALKDFYLAGGTGLALHLGHRLSYDLDFFRQGPLDTWALLRQLHLTGLFSIEYQDADTLTGIFNDVKLSFFRYDYSLLRPLSDFRGCALADPVDIALMKITAIGGRGKKKDFYDLFEVCLRRSLEELLRLLALKYPGVAGNRYHYLRSLAYFADADPDPEPRLLSPRPWDEVKAFFRREVERLMQDLAEGGSA